MTKPIQKWAAFVWPTEEEWRAVAGFTGYEVSNWGRIRSLRWTNARLLTPQVDKDGYLYVRLRVGKGYSKLLVSRGVCAAFNGAAPADKPICCHGDNNPGNNLPGNLRWDTQVGNVADKLLHGTHQSGSRHPRAQIDEGVATAVKGLLRSGCSGLATARQLGISQHIVNDISRGRTWGHA